MNVNIKELQQSINDALAVKERANKELMELHIIAIDLGYVIGDSNELVKISVNN